MSAGPDDDHDAFVEFLAEIERKLAEVDPDRDQRVIEAILRDANRLEKEPDGHEEAADPADGGPGEAPAP